MLDYDRFVSEVAPVLADRSCNAGGNCHGGGIRGTLQLSPNDERDLAFDFEQVSLQVWGDDPSGSPLLTNPLAVAAGGRPHAFEPFATTSDPGYQTLLNWINAGQWHE